LDGGTVAGRKLREEEIPVMTKREWNRRTQELHDDYELHEYLRTGRPPAYFDEEEEPMVIHTSAPIDDRLITLTELLADYVPFDRTTMWRWIRDGKFPPPLRIASRLRWRLSVVQKWISEQR